MRKMNKLKKTNKEKFSESIGDFIIAMLLSNKSTYQFRKIIQKRELSRYKKESIQVILSRLNKKGYLNNSSNGWSLTTAGRIYAKKTFLFSYISSPFDKNSVSNSNRIVSFDIPETQRRSRDWLRNQLKIFGYKMLQQSLWFGPGPLPSIFLKRLSNLKIKDNVKIFLIKKEAFH